MALTSAGLRMDGGVPIQIYQGGSEVVRIDTSGRLGIGTSLPSSYYSGADNLVVANTSGNAGITVATATTGTGRLFFADGTSGADEYRGWVEYDHAADRLTLGSNGATALAVDSSQRVGIGTTSASFLLDLFGTTPALRIQANGVANGVKLEQSSATGDVELNVIDTYPLIFKTANTERCRLTADGKFLVGTSTSNGAFDSGVQIAGSGSFATQVISGFTNNVYGGELYLAKSRSGTVGTNTIVQSGDRIGFIGFYGADGTTYRSGAQIEAIVDGTPGSADMPGRLVFSTTADGASSPTERMRIDNAGRIYTYNTDAYAFNVGTAAAAGAGDYVMWATHSRTAVDTGGTNCFGVFTNGNVVNINNSYGSISDLKLKENIVDAGSQWSDLKALQVRNYNFKEETGHQIHTQIGLVAQEVELVSPGLVSESPDRDEEGNDLGTVTKSVNYSVLYMKAVKALQEAMERIEQLEAEMAEVKAQLS
jgi:hypothetical protein